MPEKNTHIEQGKGKGKEPKKGFIETYHNGLRSLIETVLHTRAPAKKVGMPTLGREFLSACERGNPKTLEIFFEGGMDVNYQDPLTGQTALHTAVAAQARKAVLAILATGKCNFLIRDNKGRLSSEMAYLYGNDPALARLLGNKERKQAEAQGIKLTRRPPSKPKS